jgi:murein DD-endopeptidase MepM/ murein hydrolase activator NlpD
MRQQTPAPVRAARRRPFALAAATVVVAVTVLASVALAGPPAQADVEPAPAGTLRPLFEPVGRIAGGNVDVVAATTAHMITAATPPPPPPVACPVPAAEFVDSWGFARSGGRQHKGVDMMAPHGSPVLAPVAGTIRASNSALGGLGFWLDDDEGNTYFGSHLATLIVSSGRVEAGTPIGTVGSTGNASTPHLHLEVMLAGTGSVNPYPFAAEWCGPEATTPQP